jgi:hypothetical protein
MAIIIKAVPVEAHWSIGVVKRYHAELRRAYQMITEDLDVSKEIALQMAVKAINDTAGPDDLVPTLLVFGAYPRMHAMDPPAPSITQRAMTIEKAMIEIRKFRAERQVANALNTRNGPIVTPVHDLPLNSDVLVWRDNPNQRGKWTGPFKLLGIESETCKIALSSEPTDFRSTVIKPFLIEPINDVKPTNEIQSTSDIENIQPPDTRSSATTRPTRARRLPLRYQNFADITVFLQDDDPLSNQFENPPTPTFAESRRKEINGLLEKRVFELITFDAVPRHVRIFNSRFVDEIKHPGTADAYEKSRLVIQAYNDQDKTLVLTQSPTIQRMSQRIILALTASIPHCHLYLRDITQAYVQSNTPLNRKFFIRPPPELDLPKDSILRVVKPLYGVPEAETHWFNTYQKHHKEKLLMVESTFDPCLLHTIQTESTKSINQSNSTSHFGIVGLQTDDTLILADDEFAALEEKKLARAHLTSKKREKLNLIIPIKFNGGLITLANDDNDKSLLLTQPKQFDQIRLIDVKTPVDLISSRGEVRKMITPKDQYIAQRARGAYIATVSQPEASFDLSFAAQTINPKEKDAKRLNQRLQ